MKATGPIPLALGDNWGRLHPILQRHYLVPSTCETTEHGHLDIEYPAWILPIMTVLSLFGILVNQRGQSIPTKVIKWNDSSTQYWSRSIKFQNRTISFNSRVEYAQGNEIIEYVNSFLGLKMVVSTVKDNLVYQSRGYILKLPVFTLSWPEWLALGKAYIIEKAVDNDCIEMDFTLSHPLFGRLFRYAGRFGLQPGRTI